MAGFPCRIFETKDGRIHILVPKKAKKALTQQGFSLPEYVFLIPDGERGSMRFKKTL